ncbi:TspO/MBR family protein [Mesonia sp. K7]|uniref:TspO/MBR family protein n=1 Tax=Mesonia sp. K7 TaxID=2218606 RepID=UPI000DA9027D|nr:TspO/MBR family protein [Mesonia sp. K7]PZD79610.1 tryptophan-rich sensory protein [Mesonia sp. K7]
MVINLKYVFLSVLVCLLVGFVTVITIQSTLEVGYNLLSRPSFELSGNLFLGIWLVIFSVLGVAIGLVCNRGLHHVWVKTAFYHFGFILLLNTAWAITFFGLNQLFLSLLIISALLILIFFTIKWFKIASNLATYLLIPYIAWVVYMWVLNFEIWRLN